MPMRAAAFTVDGSNDDVDGRAHALGGGGALFIVHIDPLASCLACACSAARLAGNRMAAMSSAKLGDKILAIVATILAIFYSLSPGDIPTGIATTQAILAWCFVPFCWFWRSRPVFSATGLLLCLAGWSATWLWGLPYSTGITPWLLAAPMAVFSNARYCPDRRIPRSILGLTMVASVISPAMWALEDNLTLSYTTGKPWLFGLSFHWLILVSAYLAATRLRGQAQERRAREKERLSGLLAAQEEERLLISRELHDVLAHSLTLIKVQASAALIAADKDPGAASAALESIKGTSAEALKELRRIVHTLRSPQSESRQPTHQLHDLEALLSGFRNAGLSIEEDLNPAAYHLPAVLQLALTRIISEALTNVLRHQGPGSRVIVSVQIDATVQLRVESWQALAEDREREDALVAAVGPAREGTGTGIIGLKERAEVLGGSLESCGDAQHFLLRVELPTRSES
ncbi:two-component sensor histidine kinase [Corynebacterium flavescens]|nr:two-component sensor histidine kinase [Corynebacterium flavescens]